MGAWGYYDTQTSAQAILALLPYADDADVAAAIETLTAGILAYQNDDGGFGYASYSTASNLDATANIVAALAALGYDMTDAVAWLVAQADNTLDGYADNEGSYDETMTSATVLMALAAQAGLDSTGAAYNVYELVSVASGDEDATDDATDDDATAGAATAEEESTADATAEEDDDSSSSSSTSTSSSSTSSSLTDTGDDAAPYAAAAGALALCALAACAGAARRVRERETAQLDA